jgi:hydroxymethylpyrimidine/phosphomethylpyrimidine kinase
LLDDEGLQVLQNQLLSRCTLMTPNLIEAAALLDEPTANDATEQTKQAEALLRFGAEAVLLKGGHGTGGDSLDVLATKDHPPVVFRAKRLNVTMRGTGCALSSAIAALMAAGVPMESACQRAKTLVHEKLRALAPANAN